MAAQVDHLVVLANDLAQGVHWCQQTLGVAPGPGGEHALMGTHNRLLLVGTEQFPACYLEIIAINSAAPCPRWQQSPPARRWFDMDDSRVQRRLQQHGPFLAHWVARTEHLTQVAARWGALGLDAGEPLALSRRTPQAELHWQILLRPDGQRLLQGCLPALIQWHGVHPSSAMAQSPVRLLELHVQHPQADLLRSALDALPLPAVAVAHGPGQLRAVLDTPLGRVQLQSHGI